MEIMLLAKKYNTNPAGKLIKITVMNMGMSIIIFAWVGSPAVGDIFCCKKNVAPIIIVSKGMP